MPTEGDTEASPEEAEVEQIAVPAEGGDTEVVTEARRARADRRRAADRGAVDEAPAEGDPEAECRTTSADDEPAIPTGGRARPRADRPRLRRRRLLRLGRPAGAADGAGPDRGGARPPPCGCRRTPTGSSSRGAPTPASTPAARSRTSTCRAGVRALRLGRAGPPAQRPAARRHPGLRGHHEPRRASTPGSRRCPASTSTAWSPPRSSPDPLRRHDTLAWERPLDLDRLREASAPAARPARLRGLLPPPRGRDDHPGAALAGLGPVRRRSARGHGGRRRVLPLDGALAGRCPARGGRRPQAGRVPRLAARHRARAPATSPSPRPTA